MFVDRIDRGAAETIMDFLSRSDATMRVAQLRALEAARWLACLLTPRRSPIGNNGCS
jgi:hypothetical protein